MPTIMADARMLYSKDQVLRSAFPLPEPDSVRLQGLPTVLALQGDDKGTYFAHGGCTVYPFRAGFSLTIRSSQKTDLNPRTVYGLLKKQLVLASQAVQ